MKLKINFALLMAYLVGISFAFKKIEYISLALAILIFLFGAKIRDDIKNFIYVIVALTPFLPFLALFIIYLPFSFFGFILDKPDFIKRYLFGFSISVFTTLMIYTVSKFIGIPLNAYIIFLLFYAPIPLAAYKAYKNKNLHSFMDINAANFKIIIISLFFLFLVTDVMLTDNTLFMSNGTYFYSKYNTIVKSIQQNNDFPVYSPLFGQGLQMFLVDSPAFFTHMGFIKFIASWLDSVLYFNYYEAFILFLTILGASLLINEVLTQQWKKTSPYVTAIGSSAIVISFVFLQYLESVKQFFALPVGLLIFSLVLGNPRTVKLIGIIASLLILSLLIHATHSLAIGVISLFLFVIIQFDKESIFRNINEFRGHIMKNKNKLVVFLIIFLIPLFYVIPNIYYSDFLRSAPFNKGNVFPNAVSYLKTFSTVQNPISVHYPDLRRNDDKEIGFFLSAFGLFAIAYALFNIRKPHFKKANIFLFAFLFSIIASSIIVDLPVINNMEYGDRFLVIYELVTLVTLICVVINSFRLSVVRWSLLIVLLIGFAHSIPYIKTNLSNIHQEPFIGAETYKNEIEFIKRLPIDGRIITYGHFSNAVDAGLNTLTDRYLARIELKQIDYSKSVYYKIHDTDSWGYTQELDRMSDMEFVNYLRIGGYKYLFLNICHPAGNKVIQKVYPDFAFPIYQDQANGCNVILTVNNSNYAEKVNVVSKKEEEDMRNKGNGYLFVSINKDFGWYDADDYEAGYPNLENPEPVSFERIKPSIVILHGNFNDDDWVVFKELYFPRWKAYVDGKEVPVLSTDNDLILIKAAKGNEIVLENALLPIEKISGFVSFLAIVSFIAFLIFML